MKGERSNYWQPATPVRYSRRTILRGASIAAAGLAGGAMLACKTTNSGSSNAAQTAQGQSVSSLIGRTGPDPKSETPVRGGTLNWYMNSNPPTFDPTLTVSALTSTAISPVMSRLFRPKLYWDVASGNNQELEPELAVSVESPDAVTWTVKLRQDAAFHNIAPVNGRALDAEDVKATFTRAASPASANRGSLLMIDPAAIQTPDKNTVVFKLKFPYASFRDVLASGSSGWLLSREAAAGDYDPAKKAIGTGPFTMESYTPDIGLTYKRNAAWFEKNHPYIDGAKIAIITDPAQRFAQFTGGHLDYIVLGTAPDDLKTLQEQNPKAETIRNWDAGAPVVYFQLGDPNSPFQDIRLRQAVSLAIDRATFGNVILDGHWTQGWTLPESYGKWAIQMDDLPPETQQWYKFDLPRAKQLVEQAGGGNLNIRFIHAAGNPRDPAFLKAGQIIVNMLSALPWHINLVQIDYVKDWVAGGKGVSVGNFASDSIVWWTIAGRTGVDDYLSGYWGSSSTNSISRLKDPAFDALIDEARTQVNDDERVKAYKDAQKYLAAKVYSAAGNATGLTYWMDQSRVRNLALGDTGTAWSQLWLNQ
jgi:peptide/nickel transport system substrate-binding protein